METETDIDTESDVNLNSDTDSKFLNSSDSDDENITYQRNNKLQNFLRVTISILLEILKVILILALIVAVWFLTRFIVLKLRFIRFTSPDTRKGAKAMYLHSLWILKIAGVTPKKEEGDRQFAGRAVLQIDGIKTKDYQKFTDFALNARFGKDSPSEQDILQMNDFLKTLSEGVYNSSRKWKRLLMKYVLFLM